MISIAPACETDSDVSTALLAVVRRPVELPRIGRWRRPLELADHPNGLPGGKARVRLVDLQEDVAGGFGPPVVREHPQHPGRDDLPRRHRAAVVERVGEHARRVVDVKLQPRQPRVVSRVFADMTGRVVEREELRGDDAGEERREGETCRAPHGPAQAARRRDEGGGHQARARGRAAGGVGCGRRCRGRTRPPRGGPGGGRAGEKDAALGRGVRPSTPGEHTRRGAGEAKEKCTFRV